MRQPQLKFSRAQIWRTRYQAENLIDYFLAGGDQPINTHSTLSCRDSSNRPNPATKSLQLRCCCCCSYHYRPGVHIKTSLNEQIARAEGNENINNFTFHSPHQPQPAPRRSIITITEDRPTLASQSTLSCQPTDTHTSSKL